MICKLTSLDGDLYEDLEDEKGDVTVTEELPHELEERDVMSELLSNSELGKSYY